MDNFLRYFIQDIGQLFYDFIDIFNSFIEQIVNCRKYTISIFKLFFQTFIFSFNARIIIIHPHFLEFFNSVFVGFCALLHQILKFFFKSGHDAAHQLQVFINYISTFRE